MLVVGRPCGDADIEVAPSPDIEDNGSAWMVLQDYIGVSVQCMRFASFQRHCS